MIATQIKRGATAPTIDDLKDCQLGFDTINNRLYIRKGQEIIELCVGKPVAPIVDNSNNF